MRIIEHTPPYRRLIISKMISEFNSKILLKGDNGFNTLSEAVLIFWQALCYISGNQK
jgi:hypothetical protein